MASHQMDQENQHSMATSRLALRKENVQKKTALSNLNPNYENIKNIVPQQQQQLKKVKANWNTHVVNFS